MKINNENAPIALNLHEKGIISAGTLLKEFGINFEDEVKKMREEYELHKSLCNHEQHSRKESEDKQLIVQLIEQTRRNIEVLSKSTIPCIELISKNMLIMDKLMDLATKSVLP